MTKPYWFMLLEQWEPKRMGELGVTLPFIVGALAYKAGQTDLGAQQVRNVLEDITKHPVEGCGTEVSWCHNISAPVLNTTRINAPRMNHSVAIQRPSGEGESLVFGPNICSKWNSKDPSELLDILVEKAAEPVSKGRYSRKAIWKADGYHEYEWNDFRPNELDYIQGTIITS